MPAPDIRPAAGNLWATPKATAGPDATLTFPINDPIHRELLPRLDLDAFEKALNGWLGQHRGQLPSTLAFDGKCIRENLGAIVTLLDVEEGVPVAVAATTVGKGGEVACARKLLHSDQVALENTTLIADSLHTNAT